MRSIALCLSAAALLVGAGCHGERYRPGFTRVLILNATSGSISMNGDNIEYWRSATAFIAHADSGRVLLSRNGQGLGAVVLVSTLPEEDPSGYDAAVNLHEDSAGLRLVDFTPYVDCRLEGP